MAGLSPQDIPPYLFADFVWRENVIRHVDERAPDAASDPNSYGISATTMGRIAVEYNMIDTGAATPLAYRYFGFAQHLQNKTAAGKLVRGFDQETQSALNDLEMMLEQLCIMSYL
jgi:hypothetical protein